jgi:hypothetical protein
LEANANPRLWSIMKERKRVSGTISERLIVRQIHFPLFFSTPTL